MRVLITGATGLIGSKIVEFCSMEEIGVNYLTRDPDKIKGDPKFLGFHWDPQKGEIDTACLNGVDAIINLAGANIFHLWTETYKEKLRNSRLDALNLLYKTLENNEHQVKQIVSASAIGIYPSEFQKIYNEANETVDDSFLGKLVQDWEKTTRKFSNLGMEVAIIRTGLVLAKKGGALPIFKLSVNNYLGAVLGNGKQWQSWIHLDDLARMYLFAVIHNLDGIYNGVAPNPVTNEELTHAIATHLDKPLWLPKIPAFALKTFLGKMGNVALTSQLVESKKIQEMGFRFNYLNINKALDDLL